MGEGDVDPSGASEARGAGRATGRTLPVLRDRWSGPRAWREGSGEGAPDDGPGVLAFFRLLARRRWLIASVAAGAVAIGTIVSLMRTPLYTATVRLQIDRHTVKVVEAGNVTASESWEHDFLRTQYELLQSRTLAERVVATLGLADDADFLAPRESSIAAVLLGWAGRAVAPDDGGSGRAARERAAARIVLANRAVKPVTGSRLVDIACSDPDPARAQKIAAAFADAFIASTLDKRFEANAYAKAFLEDQLKQLELRLAGSEKALLAFAEKEQIVSVTEKSTMAESNLAGANAALGTIVAERIRSEQLWRQVEAASTINLPQLLSNAAIEGLRARRNALAAEYQEKLETFKPGYPAMAQISSRISELDRQLAAEVGTLKQAYKAAYDSALGQELEMRRRIEQLGKEVLDLQKRSIQFNILKREVDTNRSLYESLLQRYKEVDIAGGVGATGVFVVDRAELPGAPSSPRLPRALLLSLALGLGGGIAAAFVLERLDDRLRTAEELESVCGLPTLGIIPRVGRGFAEKLADARSAPSEAYRALCASLQLCAPEGLPKSVLVTSAGAGEGKSVTALAVARHFAAVGLEVLLVDADLRKPSAHAALGASNAIGLATYLAGACSPPDALQKTAIAKLAFLAAGPPPANAADLLVGARLPSLLAVGAEVFDLIVLDGPPVLGLADAQLLSSAAAATIFVVAAGQARAGLVRGALERLQLARARPLGTVLTKYDARQAGYGHPYGYGYGYRYGADRAAADGAEAGHGKALRLEAAQRSRAT